MSLTVEQMREMLVKIENMEPLPAVRRLLMIHRTHHRIFKRLKKRYTAKRSWQRGAR